MQVRDKSPSKEDHFTLEKGQVWSMHGEQLHIHRTGKRLVEFRILKGDKGLRGQRLTRSSLETMDVVKNYLERNKAKLKKDA